MSAFRCHSYPKIKSHMYNITTLFLSIHQSPTNVPDGRCLFFFLPHSLMNGHFTTFPCTCFTPLLMKGDPTICSLYRPTEMQRTFWARIHPKRVNVN